MNSAIDEKFEIDTKPELSCHRFGHDKIKSLTILKCSLWPYIEQPTALLRVSYGSYREKFMHTISIDLNKKSSN